MADTVFYLAIKADSSQAQRELGAVNTRLGQTEQAAGAASVASTRLTEALGATARAGAGVAAGTQQAGAALGKSGQDAARAAAAHQVSASQIAAAYRQLPAQLTDVATQLAGGANPLLVLLQQGGQVKDSFGGFRPMFTSLAGAITPVGLAIGGLAAGLAAFAGGAIAGYRESLALNGSLARTGNLAGLTLGQIDALSRGLVASGNVTIGTARDITAALVDTGQFGARSLGAAGSAAAVLARITGKSSEDIVSSFAAAGDSATAWSLKANKAYAFLTAAQLDQIRTLESQGRNDEAVRLAMESLAGTMEQRMVPNLGTLERSWQAVKNVVSGVADDLKNIGRDQTPEQKLAQLQSEAAGLRGIAERSTEGAGGGLLGQWLADRANAAADVAQAEADAFQQSKNRSDLRRSEEAIAAREEQRKITESSRAHIDAMLAVEAAGAAQRLASLQVQADRRRQAVDAEYTAGLTSAQSYVDQLVGIEQRLGASKVAEIDRQIAAEKRRPVSNPQEVQAQQAALGQLQARRTEAQLQAEVQARELRRGLSLAADALELADQQNLNDQALRLLEAAQAGLEQRRRAGLVSEAEAAQASLAIERAKLEQQGRLLDAQIALEEKRTASGAAEFQRQAGLARLRSQRAGIQAQVDAVPGRQTGLADEQRLADARAAAQAWAQTWAQADEAIFAQTQSNAEARAALLTDPLEQARVQTRLQIQRIERDVAPLKQVLELRISLTTDPAQRQELERQLAAVTAATADAIAVANDGLAERMKPGWQRMVEGWSDTTRLMREANDEMLQQLVKGGEDAFVNLVRTGKVNLKSLSDDLINTALRTRYREMVGSAAGKDGLSSIAGFLGLSPMKAAPKEGDKDFMGPLQEMSDAAGDAATRLQGAADAGALLNAQSALASTGLGKLAGGLMSGVQAVLSFVASLSAQSAGDGFKSLMSLAGLLGGGMNVAPGGTMTSGVGSLNSSQLALLKSANGNVFGAAAFAAGGSFTNSVVSSPTYFKFAQGGAMRLGLMGEAGPEAIMPLTRSLAGGQGVAALDGRGRQVGVLPIARGPGGRLSVVMGGEAGAASPFARGGAFGRAMAFASGGAFEGAGQLLARAATPAGAGQAGAAGDVRVSLNPTIQIDARTDQAQVRTLVERAMQQVLPQAQRMFFETIRRNSRAAT